MENVNTRKFILGKPVEVPYGKVRFLTLDEYMDLESDLQLISMNTLHLYYAQKKHLQGKVDEVTMKEFDLTKELPLYNLVLQTDHFLHQYLTIFDKVIEFNEEYTLSHLFESEDKFNEIRSLIMMMQFLKEAKVYKNEELQRNHELGNLAKTNKDAITLEDIITSVVASGHSYDEVEKMTVYQLNALYLRISAIKDYETTTLFATVSTESKIEHWTKHIDLFESKDNSSIKLSDFKSKLSEAF